MCRAQYVVVHFKCRHIQGPAWELTPHDGCGGCKKLISGEVPAGVPQIKGCRILPVPCFPCIAGGKWRVFKETWMSTANAVEAGWVAES